LHVAWWHRIGQHNPGYHNVHMKMVSELNDSTAPKSLDNSVRVLSGKAHHDYDFISRVINAGEARGHMVGGNIAVLATMMVAGKVDSTFFDGAILVLEDVDEENSRLDRIIASLCQNEHLHKVAALIIGRTAIKESISTTRGKFYTSMPDMLREHTRGTPLENIPVIWNAPFGHEPENLPFFYGAPYDLSVGQDGTTRLVLVK